MWYFLIFRNVALVNTKFIYRMSAFPLSPFQIPQSNLPSQLLENDGYKAFMILDKKRNGIRF